VILFIIVLPDAEETKKLPPTDAKVEDALVCNKFTCI